MRRSSAGAAAMVQRHFIVVSWPLTADFVDTARRYGVDRDGWRALMAAEIDATTRGLEEARVGAVAASFEESPKFLRRLQLAQS